ncbi:MAG TPA: NAD(P)-dependent oxidoreductase [Stackebrandtia sp.]|uniref:NAD(P)-dependent oxidoreductase n=1 Tax=Stackebrandtia sp. TaxID=2023065 RepID=UPI002D5F4F14|nr:NAD(P)-dependent oxidoreductase [Stackebrandtia sp.]HZE41427.1 NAD(P)-dependent oxidoreductase [Stackebrandtia sp.]
MWIHVQGSPDRHVLDVEVPALERRHPEWTFTVSPEPPPASAYEVLIAGRPGRELLAASPKLRAVVVPFAGIPERTSRLLSEFPALEVHTLHHNAGPTAELALALTLAAARGVVPADRGMRRGDWTARFTPPEPSMLLDGHPATVAGYGAIGRRVARGLAALGMRVRATRASADRPRSDGDIVVHPARDLPALLDDSRVTVLALPAGPDTAGLIGAEELARLPEPSVLVNVSRAALVDEEALYRRLLRPGFAAGLDVWWEEAGSIDAAVDVAASRFAFHELPNVVLSPHRGGAFSIPETRRIRVDHLETALAGLAARK